MTLLWNSEYEFIFSLTMALHIACKYLECLLVVVTNLTVYFVGLVLLPFKIYADAINELQ